MGVRGSFLKKTEAGYAELNERREAATSSYSVTGDFSQYIYSMPVTKNHQNIRPRCSPCAEGPKLGVRGTSEGRNFACFFG